MQIVIDTAHDSPVTMRLIARVLLDVARQTDGDEYAMTRVGGVTEVPEGTALPSAATIVEAPTFKGAEVVYDPPNREFAPLDPAVVFAKTPPAAPDTVMVIPGAPCAALIPPPPVPPAADPYAALDKDGLPHDPRIHSATPTKTADGRWRKRRNLEHSTLTTVEAELRLAYPKGVTVNVGPGVATVQVVPPPPPPPPVSGVVGANAAPPVVPPPPPPPAAPVTGFRALMALVGPHTGVGGKLAKEVMAPIHAEFGATSWSDYVHLKLAAVPALTLRIEEILRS